MGLVASISKQSLWGESRSRWRPREPMSRGPGRCQRGISCKIWYSISRTVSEDDVYRDSDQSFFMVLTSMKMDGETRADTNRPNLPSIVTC
jgi:hypothetical protein